MLAIKNGAIIIGLLTICLIISSNSMVISSPMDNIEQCIYTCSHCFKEKIVVKCANECITSSGNMPDFFLRICPQFNMPLYFDVGVNSENRKLNDLNNEIY